MSNPQNQYQIIKIASHKAEEIWANVVGVFLRLKFHNKKPPKPFNVYWCGFQDFGLVLLFMFISHFTQ